MFVFSGIRVIMTWLCRPTIDFPIH